MSEHVPNFVIDKTYFWYLFRIFFQLFTRDNNGIRLKLILNYGLVDKGCLMVLISTNILLFLPSDP